MIKTSPTRPVLLALALFASSSANAQQSKTVEFESPTRIEVSVIEVLGRADLEFMPNRARFNVTFRETDREAEEALQSVTERARLAYSAIKAIAGEASQVSTSVTVDPYYDQYRDDDGDRVENTRPDKVRGYNAEARFDVVITDTALAGQARAGALVLSPEASGAMRLYLERTAEVQAEAYRAAVADAVARAEATADATGKPLGELLLVQEGTGACLGRWSAEPGRVSYANAPAPSSAQSLQERVVVTGSRRRGGEVTITQDQIDALDLPSDPKPESVRASVCAIYTIDQ